MDKKYFFFDIDGTLTNYDTGVVVPSALETIRELEKNGHFVAIATGRQHYKARYITDKIGVKNIVCSGGGCLVIDGTIVEDKPLPLEKSKEILEHAEKDNVGYLVMVDDSPKVLMKDIKFIQQAGRRKEVTTYDLDENFDFHDLDKIYKMYLAIKEKDLPNYPWVDILPHMQIQPNYFLYQYDSKNDGIKRMLKHVGGDIDDVVVFGDGINDVVMFDEKWFSVAMGNAPQELKEKADYITDTSVNDGIYKACKKFGWID